MGMLPLYANDMQCPLHRCPSVPSSVLGGTEVAALALIARRCTCITSQHAQASAQLLSWCELAKQGVPAAGVTSACAVRDI
jgi:hypothetical protein